LIGDQWVKRGDSAVLEVPSAVIATDSNYLLNPHHSGFKAIRVMPPRPFDFDFRLLGR
jgi:RES domain-containing protein